MLFDYIPQKKPESLLDLTMRFFLDFLLEYDILILSKEEIMISVYFYFRILWRVRAGIPLNRFHFVPEEEFYGGGVLWSRKRVRVFLCKKQKKR